MSNFYANEDVKEYSEINGDVIKDKELNMKTDGKRYKIIARNRDIIETINGYIDEVKGPMMKKLVQIHDPQEREEMFKPFSFRRTPTPYPNANRRQTKKKVKRRMLKKKKKEKKEKKRTGGKKTKRRK